MWHEAPEVMEQWEQFEETTLSIHVVEGSQGVETIKMLGAHKNRQLAILADSESTSIFVDKKVVDDLELPLIQITSVAITMANGRKITCRHLCQSFGWKVQKQQFCFDLRALDIGDLI